MHILIPMAGHSRRFTQAGYDKPKFLIPIGDKIMIEHVVDMFAPEDHFHFIINQNQADQYPGLHEILAGIIAEFDITIIAPHEKGPTYSVLQVQGIPDDQPVIISYCDFTISWNYDLFRRHVEGHDAAMPVFRGLHPASTGNTNYAYVRTVGNRVLELREKQSFTKNRMLENASAGIYYFGSWEIFQSYAKKLLDSHSSTEQEAYVSLITNLLVADGMSVIVHLVDRFICFGTPQDVEEYRFWYEQFCTQRQIPHKTSGSSYTSRRVNLIPLAGKGDRFQKAGYKLSKPLIPIQGTPMLIRAARTFPPADHWILLPREQDYSRHPVQKTIDKFFPQGATTVIPVIQVTSGQATTCLLAENKLEDNDSLFIGSCDYEHIYDHTGWQEVLNDKRVDGAIWTYRFNASVMKDPSSFAYCRVGDDGRTVIEVVEKRPISDHPERDPLAVGSFWYRHASDFLLGVKSMLERKVAVGSEHYVGTSINELIVMGRRFVIFDVEKWVSFGDPFELEIFEYWESYFYDLATSTMATY